MKPTNEARNRKPQLLDVEESIKPPNASLKTINVIFAKGGTSRIRLSQKASSEQISQESKQIESTKVR